MTEALIASLLGGSIVGLLAKYAITRALTQLDSVSEKITNIDKRLAGIDVYVNEINHIKLIMSKHDRKLVELDTRLRGFYGGPNFYSAPGFATTDQD